MSVDNNWLILGDNFNIKYFCHLVEAETLYLILPDEWQQIEAVFEKFKTAAPTNNDYYSSKSIGYLMQLIVNAYLTECRAFWLLNHYGNYEVREKINNAVYYAQTETNNKLKYLPIDGYFSFNSGNTVDNHDIFNPVWATKRDNSWSDLIGPPNTEINQIKTVEVKAGKTSLTSLYTTGRDFFSPHNADLVLYQNIYDINTFVCYIKDFSMGSFYAKDSLDYIKLLSDKNTVLKLDCSDCFYDFNVRIKDSFDPFSGYWSPQVLKV